MPDIPPGFDFSDPDLYARRMPAREFAELRRTAPVWWNAQPRGTSGYDDDGYWVVTRHADVTAASRASNVFSSWANTATLRCREGGTREDIENQRLIMLNTDPPQHTWLRGIVSRAFTPRAIASLRPALTARAEQIVQAALTTGTGDFVADVASDLPLQAITELIGIPAENRGQVCTWTNQMMGNEDPEFAHLAGMAAAELIGYSMGLAEERRGRPRDDIVTTLINAEVDGRALTAAEFGFFVILLAAGGTDTTRNAISHGMLAFLDHPDQWELFKAERPQSAPDEIVRWATPVTVFQRTALTDTVLGGQEVEQGQRVGLFYRSANFDENVFDAPDRFDILRSPNPHLGYGTGTHYCLGASLAKLEVELMFNAIADRMPDIRKAGEPERLRSSYLNGIKKMPVAYR